MAVKKYTTLIIFLLLTSIFLFASSANAQWALPAKVFNLIDDLDEAILNLTNWLLGLIAMASVVAMIWGGINYLGSSGDTQKADLSKKIIYYALMGLFVGGIAYAMVKVITTVILKP